MFLLGFRRKLTVLALCKSIESAIQWFQIHHRITFETMQNPAVYLSGARVTIFSTLVPRLQLRNSSPVEHGLYTPLDLTRIDRSPVYSSYPEDRINTGLIHG